MAHGETLLSFTGVLCSGVATRRLDDGGAMATFCVMSTERRFDKESGNWVDGRFFRVRVRCFRALADNVRASLSEGDPVVVSGRLRTVEHAGESGPRYETELEAFAVGPNLRQATALVTRTRRASRAAGEARPAAA